MVDEAVTIVTIQRTCLGTLLEESKRDLRDLSSTAFFPLLNRAVARGRYAHWARTQLHRRNSPFPPLSIFRFYYLGQFGWLHRRVKIIASLDLRSPSCHHHRKRGRNRFSLMAFALHTLHYPRAAPPAIPQPGIDLEV